MVPGLGDGVSESRSYDESGRVVEVRRYYQPGTWMWMNTGQGWAQYDLGGALQSIEATTYDADGRVLTITTRARKEYYSPPPNQPILEFPPMLDIDPWNESDLTEVTSVSYTGGTNLGYDAAGRVMGYQYNGGNYVHVMTQ
ncbi:hypothetical protein [Stenotrophomonas acidaminiphila]|uniref:hypothetical protein n=1 Tax=Stenotrophomonas acidaminiphila TaxID=128780 RepID=UPI0028A2419C|nr:hypothetical protein [Stenotrophomonas acidaminiphila]